ncbi:MAG: tyrosine-type recombinase/integrase, partial [Sinobacteraceae bacterium]|nr:tyrosine-type recombinase/integrase [Nevskiaceae bacterium]
MSDHNELPVSGTVAAQRALTAVEIECFETLLSNYEAHQRGTLGKEEGSIKNTRGAIRGALRYIGLPPWAWRPAHIDAFLSYRAVELGVSASTQAIQISALRLFQNYILSDLNLCNYLQCEFGTRPESFITAENAIPYKRKAGQHKKLITPLDPAQCQTLLAEYDFAINAAEKLHRKSYNTLRRDKTITFLFLATGIRAEELAHIHVHDFMADRNHPNFGDFAILRVIGKGRKERAVRMYVPAVRSVLEWYLEYVRPCFLSTRTQDPHLLFFSERGNYLCERQYRRGLQVIGETAGLPMKVHPHLLRHTYATQMAPIIGCEALQKQLGHKFLSTTLGTYYH